MRFSGSKIALAAGVTLAVAASKALRRDRKILHGEQPLKSLWMFNHYARTPNMAGGNRHYQLASLLKSEGWNTTIYATQTNERSGRLEPGVSLIHPLQAKNESGIEFVWLYSIPHTDNGPLRYANIVSFMIAAAIAGVVKRGPDIVIGSSPDLLTAFAASLVAKRHRVPFVLEIRDLWPESLIQLGLTNPAIIRPLWALQRHLYRRAEVIVCLTDGIVRGVIERGVSPCKIEMIPNASPAPEPLDPDTRDVTRQRLNWEGRTVAIWIGSHGPANNLETLVEAAGLLSDRPDMLFVFVGEGPAKPSLIEMACDLANVQFLDPVPKSEVQTLLRAADIGVIVHRNTEAVRGARPNKLFDYMAAGLPTVLNLDGEARSLVEESNSGLFATPESAQALADALRTLSDAPCDRRRLGTNGFNYVSKAHRREDTATHLSKVLGRVISAHPSNPS